MNSSSAATLTGRSTHDHCLITSCLKKIFKSRVKSETHTGYIIATHIADVKKELLQLNTNDVLELSYAYLYEMERSLPGVAFRYVVVHESNTPVLFAYFQLFTLTSRNFNLKTDKPFIKCIINFFLDLKKARVLMSGNAVRNETPCYCFNSAAINDREATQMIASAAEKIAGDEKAVAVVLKDIPVTVTSGKWLAGQGYVAPLPDNAMTLDVRPEWASLAGYTSALTRKYKTRANKIIAMRDGLSIREMEEEVIVSYEHQINRLFKNVTDNQAFALTHLSADHFSKMKTLYKGGFEVFGIFHDKQLVAFYSAFVTPVAYELYYVGFDYKLNENYQLYFNILFSGVERAIQLGKAQLKLGRTAFDSKASLGAKPVEMEYFFKSLGTPAAAVKWFVNYFSSMEDAKWKLRDPLR